MYDRSEPNNKLVMLAGIGLVLIAIGGGFAVSSLFITSADKEIHEKVWQTPTTELNQMKAQTQVRMHEYGMDDEQAQKIHIPIERAEEMLVEKMQHPESSKPNAQSDKLSIQKPVKKK